MPSSRKPRPTAAEPPRGGKPRPHGSGPAIPADSSGRRDPGPAPADPRPAPAAARAPGEPDPALEESRSEQRAAAVRAGLEPLGPRERPPALVVAIVLAGLLGLVNLVAYLAGVRIGSHRPGPGILSFSVVMGIGAWGMSRARYWAVLGFQVFVALIVLYFCLLLILASNLEGLFLCLVVIGAGGWLFWKLVRVMARIQAPAAPASPD